MSSQSLVDRTCGGSFDSPHNFNERNNLAPLFVDPWREDHVDMIGHDDRDIGLISDAMIMAARRKRNIPGPVRQGATRSCDERDEMRLEIPLQVRQIAAVELH